MLYGIDNVLVDQTSSMTLDVKILNAMIESRQKTIDAELKKKSIEENTGKPTDYDKFVETRWFLWSVDVIVSTFSEPKESVLTALENLVFKGKIKQDPELKSCFYTMTSAKEI